MEGGELLKVGEGEQFGDGSPALAPKVAMYAENWDIDTEVGESDTVRDIYRELSHANSGLKRARSNSFQDSHALMYPEHSIAALATPGGFRRHAVAASQPAEITASRFSRFLDLLPDLPIIIADPDAAKEKHLASSGKTMFTLIKAFLGAGLTYFPRGFSLAGLFPSVTMMVASCLMSTYCVLLLITTKRMLEKRGHSVPDYPTIGRLVLGQRGYAIVNATLCVSQLGFGCNYLIFSATYVRLLLRQFTDCEWEVDPKMCMIIAAVVVFPLLLVRHVKFFAMPALIGDFLILFAVFYLIGFGSNKLIEDGPADDWEVATTTPNIMMFVGTSVYAFEGIGMIVPLEASMKKPEHMPALVVAIMFFDAVIIVALSSVHYLAFGSGTAGLALENLPRGDVGSQMLVASHIFVAIVTLPLFTYPVLLQLDRALGFKAHRSGRKWTKNALRFALLAMLLLVAESAYDYLDKVIGLIGGLCCVPLALVFPPLFLLYERSRPEEPFVRPGTGGSMLRHHSGLDSDGAATPTPVAEGERKPLLGGQSPAVRAYHKLSQVDEEAAASARALQVPVEDVNVRKSTLLHPNPPRIVLLTLVVVGCVAGVLATSVAIYQMYHPDVDPVSREMYCSDGTVEQQYYHDDAGDTNSTSFAAAAAVGFE